MYPLYLFFHTSYFKIIFQVWQELELQNEPVISQLLTGISRLAAKGSLSLSDKERQSQKPSKKEGNYIQEL